MKKLHIHHGHMISMSAFADISPVGHTQNFSRRVRHWLAMTVCFLAASWFPQQAAAFDLGFYNLLDTSPKTSGADFIMSYVPVNTYFLDSCNNIGLTVLVELPRSEVQQVDPNNPNCPHLDNIKAFITGLQPGGSDHTAILGWYLYDEPDWAGVTPAQTEAVYSLIRTLSPRPVYLVLCNPAITPSLSAASQYASSYDVLMFDAYPFSNIAGMNAEYQGFGTGWRQTNAIYASLASNLGKEYCPVLQSFGAQNTPNPGLDNYRLPTLGEARFQVHMAIQTGANRLIWFDYYDGMTSKALSGQPYPYDGTTWMGPSTNAVFPALQTELHLYGDGISRGEITGGIKSAGDAHIMTKVFYSPSQNKTYVLALNMSSAAVSNVTISLNLNKTYTTATRIGAGESGSIAVSGGSFSDNFAQYQAHAYELDTVGQSAAATGTPTLACTLDMDLTQGDGQCNFSVSNDSASASNITNLVLTSATDQRTFTSFNSNANFTVTPAITSPANSSANPGFESGSAGWTLGNGNYTVQTAVKRSGSKALKYVRSSSTEYVLTSQSLSMQVFPNCVYSVGCWIKTAGVTAGNGGGATLCLEWYNSSGTCIGGSYPQGLTGTNDWTFVSVDGAVAPAGACKAAIALYLRPNSTGTAYFDDVEILQFATNVAVTNPGFESNSTGWTLGNSHYTVQTAVKRSGSKALKYVRSSSTEYVLASQTLSSPVVGKTYSMGCWIKTAGVTAGNGGGATLCLEWYNSSGACLGGSYPAGLTGTNDWTFVSGETVCPAGATRAVVSLYLRSGSTGTAYFDDVSCAYRCDVAHDAVLVFNSSGLANGSASSTTGRMVSNSTGGMMATVFFANGYRLQGLLRDKGDTDGLGHYVAELTNTKGATVEIDPSSGGQFNCRVSNLSKGVKIKRVRIDASNKPFDTFCDSDTFSTTTNAGAYNDGIYSNYAILDFSNDGLMPGDSTAYYQPGANYLYCDPAGLGATVYFSDGSSMSGMMRDVGDFPVGMINPGFESGFSSWSLWGQTNDYTIQTAVKRSGFSSMKYVRTDPSAYAFAAQGMTSVTPGNLYSAGCWIKTENVTMGNGGGATLCLEWYDSNNNYVGGTYPVGFAGTNDWTFISTGDVTCPAGATQVGVSLYLRPNSTGTAYFDDVDIIQSATDDGNYHRYVLEQ